MRPPPNLYIVPTPIGNLEDITLRALRVLKEVDFILAEDSRTSGNLLNHYNIDKKIVSHHKFNEHKTIDNIIERLRNGATCALVSDAGTPAISDPGYLLVRECIKAGLTVECLPGATAFVPALVNSGIPANQFVFEGFLPVKKGRHTRLTALAEEPRTMIFYESPHRLVKTLVQFAGYFGDDRYASVSRELSKMFEETIRGSVKELTVHFDNHQPKGEIVIVVAGK
ncbi:MAG: 16S rRNA (cytidine(1402)-2'-O)-methyltransferase [Bacteroidetes bacterium]|nr:16S rRNA (cytidine(1402)-2'-O)-methyltransferase [Bacteroidota bacterium]